MLALSPVLQAKAATVVNEAVPLVESNGMVEILMADGSARRVRKLLNMTPDALRVMTDEGIAKIPLDSLHPQTRAKLNSMVETPEEQQARLQKEAAAAQSYRERQAERERMAAADNATAAAAQRAEAARQEAARQAAAAAYERQQQYLMEAMKAQEAQRAQRKAELAERDRMEEAERQRQYQLQLAALQAQQAQNAADAQQNMLAQQAQQGQQNMAAQTGPLAAMMPAHTRAASGVDKLNLYEQESLTRWLKNGNMQSPTTTTWVRKLEYSEREVLTAWMNQKRAALHPAQPVMAGPAPRMPVDSWIRGQDFSGFQNGRIYRLGNGQAWQQIDNTAANYYPDMSGNVVKVHITANNGNNYIMTVAGAGQILVVPAQ